MSDQDEEQIQKFEDSPVKKGDFLTMSELQQKMNMIPDEETISQNTSQMFNSQQQNNNSQLTYSYSHYQQSQPLMGIEEVSEGYQSIFSKMESSLDEKTLKQIVEGRYIGEVDKLMLQIKEKDDKILILENENREYKEKIEKQHDKIDYLNQFSVIVQDQYKVINYQEQQLKEQKQQYEIRIKNLEKIIEDQTLQIKTLHRQINFTQNADLLEKIKQKQEILKSTCQELNKLYETFEVQQGTPKKSRPSSLSQHSYQSTPTLPKQQQFS